MSPLGSRTASSWAPPACKMLIHLDSLILDSPLMVPPHLVPRLACHLLKVLTRRRGLMLAIEVSFSVLVNGRCVVQQDRGAGSNASNRGHGGAVAGQGNSARRGPADGGPTNAPGFSGAAAASPQVQASTAAVAAVKNGKREYARAPPTIGHEVEIFCWRENPSQNDRRQYYGIYPGAWLDNVGSFLAGQNPKHLYEIEDLVLREEIWNTDSVDEQAAKWTQAVDRANKRSHRVKKYRCPWCSWPATLEAHGPHAPNAEDYDVRCHMTGVRGSRRQKPCEKRPEGATSRGDLIENKHKLAKHSFNVIAKHMNELEDGVP